MLHFFTALAFGVAFLIAGVFFAHTAYYNTNYSLGQTLVLSFLAIIEFSFAIIMLFHAYYEYKQLKRKR